MPSILENVEVYTGVKLPGHASPGENVGASAVGILVP